MKKTIVATANHNRKIIKVTGTNSPARYLIKQGKQYIGKTTDGGYMNKESAIKRANQ